MGIFVFFSTSGHMETQMWSLPFYVLPAQCSACLHTVKQYKAKIYSTRKPVPLLMWIFFNFPFHSAKGKSSFHFQDLEKEGQASEIFLRTNRNRFHKKIPPTNVMLTETEWVSVDYQCPNAQCYVVCSNGRKPLWKRIRHKNERNQKEACNPFEIPSCNLRRECNLHHRSTVADRGTMLDGTSIEGWKIE